MPIFRRSPAWLCIALLGFVLSSAAQTLETKPCSFCLRAAVDIVHQLEGEGEGGGGLTQAWRKLHDVAISEAWAETNWTRATRKFVQHLGATHTLLQTDVVPDRLAFQNVARATESLLHGLEPAKFCSLIGACPSCPLRAEVPSHLKRDFDLVMAVTKFAAGAGRAQQQDLGTRKGRVGVVPGTNRSEPTVLLSLGSSLRLRHRSRTAIEMRAAAKMGAAAEMEVSHLLALHGKCRDTDPDVAVPTAAAVPAVLPPHTTTSVVFASLNVENMAAFGAGPKTSVDASAGSNAVQTLKDSFLVTSRQQSAAAPYEPYDFLVVQEMTDLRAGKYAAGGYDATRAALTAALYVPPAVLGAPEMYGWIQDSHTNAICYNQNKWELVQKIQIARFEAEAPYVHSFDNLQISTPGEAVRNRKPDVKFSLAAKFKYTGGAANEQDINVWVVDIHLKAVGANTDLEGPGQIHSPEVLNILSKVDRLARRDNAMILLAGDFNDNKHDALMAEAAKSMGIQKTVRSLMDMSARNVNGVNDDGTNGVNGVGNWEAEHGRLGGELIPTQYAAHMHEAGFGKKVAGWTGWTSSYDGVYSFSSPGFVGNHQTSVFDMEEISDHDLVVAKFEMGVYLK